MPEHIGIPEWRRQNRYTIYPFAERATLKSVEGKEFPEDLLIDAVLYPLGAQRPLYISRVHVRPSEIQLVIGSPADANLSTATLTFAPSSSTVPVWDRYGRPAGALVVRNERIGALTAWGPGTYELNPRATEFCASVCLPLPATGVFGMRAETGDTLAGEVWLIGSDGVVLTVDDVLHPDPDGTPVPHQRIKINVVGDPLFRRRLCADTGPEELFTTPRFIRRVRVVGPNGEFTCSPSPTGNFSLTANNALAYDTILRIETDATGLQIYVASIDE